MLYLIYDNTHKFILYEYENETSPVSVIFSLDL